MRYVLEGEWTGYTSVQRRIVHREVITAKRAERLKSLQAIVFSDGTSLLLSVREAKPREKIAASHAYCKLIRQAEAHGSSRVLVADLVNAEDRQP